MIHSPTIIRASITWCIGANGWEPSSACELSSTVFEGTVYACVRNGEKRREGCGIRVEAAAASHILFGGKDAAGRGEPFYIEIMSDRGCHIGLRPIFLST
jgi:hypothetical protein